MTRMTAIVALTIGILIVAFGAGSYLRMRQLAASPGPVSLQSRIEVRALSLGMSETSGANTIVAAKLARQLEARCFVVTGIGAAMLLIGGVLLLSVSPRDANPEA